MILTVVGARPQFIKAAALSNAFIKAGINEEIVHTGQHYDPNMSDVFFNELNIQGVVKNLKIGSGNHGSQTGEMLIAIEDYILTNKSKVDAVLVYGDTNSTLAGALVASKLHIPVIHVEAGLRSFNKTMPEEVNRILTDHISSILFCSSYEGVEQLKKEGITQNVFEVGDIMYDAVKSFLPFAKKPHLKNCNIDFNEIYNLITIHRPSNTDNLIVLSDILDSIKSVEDKFIWPVHPRNKGNLLKLKLPDNLIVCDPFSYFEMLYALVNCSRVITDSGGLQKEAYWLRKPCITLRPQTEWIETLHNNWNQLSSAKKIDFQKCYGFSPLDETWKPLYGNGNAAIKIIDYLQKYK
jgi:UDP-GlcNAc3NAcA epimerase